MLREIILLVDNSDLSDVAIKLLGDRQVRSTIVNIETVSGGNKLGYKLPVLFVSGQTYEGIKEVKYAVNCNKYL